jgi:hypothetical protein
MVVLVGAHHWSCHDKWKKFHHCNRVLCYWVDSTICCCGLICFAPCIIRVVLKNKIRSVFFREGRKPGVFMNPQVIPTCIAFWPGEKELNLHIKHTTLEPNDNQLFLNLGCVSHEWRQYQFLCDEYVTKVGVISFNEKVISEFFMIHVVFHESRSF